MNVSNVKNCYGCGVCASACPRKIIDIKLNKKGFYEPYMSKYDLCTNCGLCVDVCAFSHKELANKNNIYASFAAWSNDSSIRNECSSGGIAFEIGKTVLKSKGRICAVKYDVKDNIAKHFIAEKETDFIQSIGSKYIQSYTYDGFSRMFGFVREACRCGDNKIHLIIGTPCQIDSVRRWAKKFHYEDHLILLDFFCHGVPSKLAWDKYLQYVKKKVGRISKVAWRSKKYGWHDSWVMSIKGNQDGNESFFSKLTDGDIFYKLFLRDFCLNPACWKDCKYKCGASSADIRVGDFWGNTYKDDEKGVSAMIVFTEKGKDIVEKMNNVTLIPHGFEIVAEGQMKKNSSRAILSSVANIMINSKYVYPKFVWTILFKMESLLRLFFCKTILS